MATAVRSTNTAAAPAAAASPARRTSAAPALRASSFSGAALRTASSTSRASARATLRVNALFGGAKKAADEKPSSPFYGIEVESIDGGKLAMSQYKGKVVLVTNVASQCGFTPQYDGLAELYNKYSSKGLVVLAAPCNQFGAQEPGSNKEIKSFAQSKGAKFPMTAKMDVNGANTSELFKYLKSQQGGLLNSDVKWNFSKFLVDRQGKVVKRYFSTSEPAEIEKDILALL